MFFIWEIFKVFFFYKDFNKNLNEIDVFFGFVLILEIEVLICLFIYIVLVFIVKYKKEEGIINSLFI